MCYGNCPREYQYGPMRGGAKGPCKTCWREREEVVENLIVRIFDCYENGDPGSPTGIEMCFERNGQEICSVLFPNEDNEDLQQAFEEVARELGFAIRRRTNANPDY